MLKCALLGTMTLFTTYACMFRTLAAPGEYSRPLALDSRGALLGLDLRSCARQGAFLAPDHQDKRQPQSRCCRVHHEGVQIADHSRLPRDLLGNLGKARHGGEIPPARHPGEG